MSRTNPPQHRRLRRSAKIAAAAIGACAIATGTLSMASADEASTLQRVDNPFEGATMYVNPDWSENAASEPGGDAVGRGDAPQQQQPRGDAAAAAGALGVHQSADVADDVPHEGRGSVQQVGEHQQPGGQADDLALRREDVGLLRADLVAQRVEELGRVAGLRLPVGDVCEPRHVLVGLRGALGFATEESTFCRDCFDSPTSSSSAWEFSRAVSRAFPL